MCKEENMSDIVKCDRLHGFKIRLNVLPIGYIALKIPKICFHNLFKIFVSAVNN